MLTPIVAPAEKQVDLLETPCGAIVEFFFRRRTGGSLLAQTHLVSHEDPSTLLRSHTQGDQDPPSQGGRLMESAREERHQQPPHVPLTTRRGT